MILCTGSIMIPNYGDHATSHAWIKKYHNTNNQAVAKNIFDVEKPENLKAIHFTGGGYINDMWTQEQSLNRAIKIKNKFGCKLILTGISLYPLDKKREEVLNLLKNFDYIDTRDSYSANIINSLSIDQSFTTDDIFISNMPICKIPNSLSVIINLQQDLCNAKQIFHNFISFLMQYMLNRNIQNIIFAQCMDTDYIPDSSILDLLKKYNFTFDIFNSDKVFREGFPIGNILITTRYHPHIVSYFCGSKGLIFVENNYYHNKHNLVREMGSDWTIVSVNNQYNFNEIFDNQNKTIEQKNKELQMLFDKKQKVAYAVLKKLMLDKGV